RLGLDRQGLDEADQGARRGGHGDEGRLRVAAEGELGLQIGMPALAFAGAERISRLGHEAVDDTVPGQAVIEARLGQQAYAGYVAGRRLGSHLDQDAALVGVDDQKIVGRRRAPVVSGDRWSRVTGRRRRVLSRSRRHARQKRSRQGRAGDPKSLPHASPLPGATRDAQPPCTGGWTAQMLKDAPFSALAASTAALNGVEPGTATRIVGRSASGMAEARRARVMTSASGPTAPSWASSPAFSARTTSRPCTTRPNTV